jgi:hypothetical protein
VLYTHVQALPDKKIVSAVTLRKMKWGDNLSQLTLCTDQQNEKNYESLKRRYKFEAIRKPVEIFIDELTATLDKRFR